MGSAVSVYQDTNYKGNYTTLNTGTHTGSNEYVRNNNNNKFKAKDVSSLKITPGFGCICYDSSGKSIVFENKQTNNKTLDIPSLIPYGFNDKITKITVYSTTSPKTIIDSNGNIKEGFAMGGKEYNFIDIIVIIISVLALCLSLFAVFKIIKLGSKLSLSSSTI